MNKVITFIAIALVALAALAAGVQWSAEIRSAFARDKAAETAAADDAAATKLWTCGMHPQVIQDHPGDCPICHMELTPLQVDDAGGSASMPTPPPSSGRGQSSAQSGERTIKYWWDPMLGPSSISDSPGKSAMGMDLVPVYEDEVPAGGSAVIIDPVVVQNMGVRIENVSEGPLRRSIRVVGYLDEAQPLIRDINLRISGWIRQLHANTEGMLVQEGDPLFDLYSPELTVAVEELISARRALGALESASDDRSRASAQSLYDAAAMKLTLWDLPRAQIETLAKLDRAPETITFTSPITGYITEKPIVEGAAVMTGDRVLRITDHSTLWVDAQVFEKDLPFIALGQMVRMNIASRPGEAIEGEIIFIHPNVDPMQRTALVRVAVANGELELRPGMYATAQVQTELAERALLVPREAVIDTGDRQVVFVAQGGGRFEPRLVEVGHAADDGMVQIVAGLLPGEPVVVSGQFLLDSESRLREAIRKFLDQRQPLARGDGSEVHDPTRHTPTSGEMAAAERKPSLAPLEWTPAIDSVARAYLDISAALGGPQRADTPVDAATLVAATHTLHDLMRGTPSEAMAVEVAGSAGEFAAETLDRQREIFKRLSDAVIALLDRAQPSNNVAERLYLVHCSMAPGSWLQADETIMNPYYGTSMKQCGEIVRIIESREAGGDT